MRFLSQSVAAVFVQGSRLTSNMFALGSKIIAVEADDSACLDAAMKAGRRVKLKEVGIFADGTAVAQIGKENFQVAQDAS